ncbi:MAG: ABC transporter permease [Lachnospiraceae bacterium]
MVKKNWNSRWKTLRHDVIFYRYLYLMLIPVFLWYALFYYAPLFGLRMAFQDYRYSLGFDKSPFVGLKNFETLFSDSYFVQAFGNTFVIALLRIVFVFPSAVLLALLFNEVKSRGMRTVVQTVTYLPHFFSWVSMAGLLRMILAEDSGLLNLLLQAIGLEQQRFLTDDRFFRTILIVSDIYKDVGWNSIIYVAALSSISPSLYESAMLDGANRRQQMWHVTLPGLAPTIAIMAIIYVGGVFNQGFDQVYNLYNPMVYTSGDIIDTYIVRMLKTNFNMSVSAASSFIKSAICMLFLIVSNVVVKRLGQESIY